MNKLFSLILIFSFFNVQAQSKFYIVNDDFKNNTYNWELHQDSQTSAKIENSVFLMNNYTKTRTFAFTNEFQFDWHKDYVIETNLRQVEGGLSSIFGLILNANTEGDACYFVITSEGGCLYRKQKNWKTDQLDTLTSEAVLPFGEFNHFKVEKKRDSMYFYINNSLVFTKKICEWKGESAGFVVSGEVKAEAENYLIVAEKKLINEVVSPLKVEKENMKAFNTEETEILPLVAPDGKTLYFTRNEEGSTKSQEIWFSELKNQKWSKAKNISTPLNNKGPNAVIYATPDNNTLIVSGKYNEDGSYAGRGLSITHRKGDLSWEIPKTIEIKNFNNDEKYINFSFTTDLQILVLSTTWYGHTYGGSDLYVSFLQKYGTYSEPLNMGYDLNTAGAEGTPFIASDGKTLYYYSSGLKGYGQADIYMSKRLDDSWTNWSEPLNMGPFINTTANEAYFTVDAEGEYAYFISTGEKSIGKEDIFRIQLEKDIQPEPIVLIYGKVFDKKTNKPIAAQILYDDLTTNKEVDVAISCDNTGKYKIVLPYGNNYGFFAQKTGYFSLSDNIDLTQIAQYEEIERNLYLNPIENEEIIPVNNLFFEKGKADILPSSYPELDRISLLLKENPNIKIEIQGHTNNVGEDDLLMQLSEDRAKSVKRYIIDKGVEKDRISTIGFGSIKPIADNNTIEGRRKNQRVEIKIIEK